MSHGYSVWLDNLTSDVSRSFRSVFIFINLTIKIGIFLFFTFLNRNIINNSIRVITIGRVTTKLLKVCLSGIVKVSCFLTLTRENAFRASVTYVCGVLWEGVLLFCVNKQFQGPYINHIDGYMNCGWNYCYQ